MKSGAFTIGPLQSSRNLTYDLVESLRAMILDGNMAPGTKLPAAKEIEEQAGVSRSVVREAVAALKAEGLIVSRQGVGMFIANKPQMQRFEIDDTEFNSIEAAIQILELRMAVELEMTFIAAKNRSEKQMSDIWNCLEAFDEQIAKGNDGVKEDLDFHLAIANASGNPYFARFIKFIGEGVISSRDIIVDNEKNMDSAGYLQTIQQEHRKIAEAIDSQAPELARYATMEHIGNSRKRHQKILNKYKESAKA